MTTRQFPAGFTWGTATASYQVEGAAHADGRGLSIWDTFCATEGQIDDGSNGDVACDQYHRYLGDIALMTELGVGAYRFSVAWPRVQPQAGEPVNQAGLDHYSRLVDALLAAGIKPVVTLYHWDLPQYLEDAGGWPERQTAVRFGDYAALVARRLGDRVDTWTTLNEPWCSAYLGYAAGEHAPGRRDHAAALAAAHHLNLGHGLAVQAVRAEVGDRARTSVTLNLTQAYPATDSALDRAAADQIWRIDNDIWLKPMLEGAYDPQLWADTAQVTDWAFVRDGDLATIRQPLSVLGLNYYSPVTVRPLPGAVPAARTADCPVVRPGTEAIEVLAPTGPLTDMGWSQEPRGLTDLLVRLARTYPGLELMVTENGSAFVDTVSPDGLVHDPERVAYLAAHIEALGQALDAGAPVSGYFAWSLLDNFEWARGYTKRFGLFRTDYDTLERSWKDTARWYQALVRSNRAPESDWSSARSGQPPAV
ncbi:MAG: beta-glucosidase [Propionibacteriaceae bacterium]|jgi:beta-glucosidase|nr:beta-glucosidase [Propionibacteriaceae bacterium]